MLRFRILDRQHLRSSQIAPMITAWQTPLGDIADEKLVRFGRIRKSLSVVVIEDATGLRVEARVGRRLVERILVGHDRDRIGAAVEISTRAAIAEMLADNR
jgi:hypothetical protein